MTVSSTTTKNSYSGDGSNTVFAYTFKVFDEDDLTVILRTDATGTETVQTITTNYTVSGVGDAGGGNVTFVTAPASGVTVVIRRAAALTQTTDYTPNDPFPAEEHENALDKLTFFAQQQQEELDRAIKLSRTNTMTSTEFTVGATDRANKILAFDGTGELSVTQELGVFRGDWTADTAFAVRDLIKDTTNDNIYICQTAHTSSGSLPISTNTDASAWELIVDAATATTSATNAAASAAAAATSETNAATSETNAATSATNAAASEASVAADAAAAAASESAAATSATNAAASETAAATSATSAASSATSATASATTATTKAAEASTSASNAATSETNAATSAASASSSATAASGSATNAATSETNAATSAASASTSASNAATSETNAATSASNAATSASNASTSETNAAASATSAASSASTATTQATNAATSASNASTSETNAATSETNAATSATNAASSATSAASSASSASSAQTAAESARDATLAAYDNFDDRYLGAKSSAPTLDNDGNALVAGALYFDTVAEAMYVYTGSSWVAAYVSGTGFLALTGGTMTGDINFGDNDKAVFGAGSDLQIYHDGTNSIIHDFGTGFLSIKATDLYLGDSGGNTYISAIDNGVGGTVSLYHNTAKKLETTATGIDVTGTVTAGGLTVDTNTLYVDSTNNRVGIGTTSPTSYHTGTRMAVYNSGDSGITIASGTANAGRLHFADGTTGNEQYRGYIVYFHSDDSMQFATSGNEKMRITSNGVGIGTTAPSYPLEVHGSSGQLIYAQATSGTAYVRVDSSNAGSEAIFWARATNTGNSVLQFGDPDDGDVGWIKYEHSSNAMAFRTNAAERMRIDSSGNVGIGTASVDNKLHLEHAGSLYLQIENTSTANKFYLGNSGGNAILQSTGAYSMNFITNGSEAARIDSSQNFLVGKTAPTISTVGVEARTNGSLIATKDNDKPLLLNRLTSDGDLIELRKAGTVGGNIGIMNGNNPYIANNADNSGLQFGTGAITPSYDLAAQNNSVDLGSSSTKFKDAYFNGTVYADQFLGQNDTNTGIAVGGNDVLQFSTAGSERARVDASGTLLVGKTTNGIANTGNEFGASGYAYHTRSAGTALYLNRLTSDGDILDFRRNGGLVGSVSVTTTGTTYNTTSDLRLKENIEPLEATDKLMAMNPVSYNWKADPDGPRSMGFIAQEMQEVMPEAVSAGDDDDAMMSMDYGRITPILVS
jgi:hypothetical protein